MEYGVTADSRIEAQGKTTALNWALNKISDRFGNAVSFTYTEDNAAGHFRINRIDYAGNSVMGTAPKASVRFVYEARTDNAPAYIAGSKITTPVRLKNIQTFAANGVSEVMVRDYRLAYDYSAATGRSRLLSSTEYDAIGVAKPATTFAWQGINTSFVGALNLPSYGPAQGFVDGNKYPTLTGDWNGDGKTDFARVYLGGVNFFVATDAGFVSYAQVAAYAPSTGYTDGSTFPIFTGDWNGDGKTDFARVHQTGIHFLNSTGTGFVFSNNVVGYAPSTGFTNGSTFPVLTGDWNGDGRVGFGRVHYTGVHFLNADSVVQKVDQLVSVVNQLGATTTLTYKPLTDSTVYTKGTGAADPVRDIQAALYVVSQASTDNGVGGQRVSTYKYGGMKVDMSGRGNLGFAWMESTDTATGISTHTAYNQTYPYVGSALFSEQKLADGTLISRSESTMAQASLNAGKTIFPYSSQSIKKSYEVSDGTNNPVVTVTTDTAYDLYGNATSITETKSDGSTRVVNNTYTNDVVNWQLGRLTLASVTSTLPGQAAQTRTSGFSYNAQGLVSQEVVEPNSTTLKLITDYTYDGFGNRVSSSISAPGAVARTTSTVYDAQGQFPVSTTNAAGHSESYVWDARFGVKSSLTGPNGLTTTWAYDASGRKVLETRADATTTTITHHMDVAPFYVSSQSTGSPTKTVYYDLLGRKIRSQTTGFNGEIIYADIEHNALGQVSRKSGAYVSTGIAKWTTHVYDAVGRVISYTKPDGSTTTTSYNGLSKSVTNALAQTRTEIKDVHGRVSQVIDSMNGTLSYTYDPFGNLTATTDAAGHVVAMSYDIRGRKIGMNDPDMGNWSYAYNSFGELISQTNARLQTTTMAYDVLGRMISRVEPEGTSSWTYDVGIKAIGKLSSESAVNGYSKNYIYDGFGRPVSTTTLINTKSFTMSTAYNAAGKVDTITYPTGFAVKRAYNLQGYLSQIQNAANAAEVFWKADVVDEDGHVLQETLGNGLTTTRLYNPLTGKLESIAAGPNGSIQNLSMTYDSIGNLMSRSDTVMGWSESFTYDALNRITGVTGPASKSYAYDAIGNITNKSDVGAYTYSPTQPHAVTTAGGNTYTYDANGNMTSGAGRTLTWTSFDRPAAISTPNAYVSMGYDANHKRISKTNTINGEVTLYVGGGFEEVTQAGITKAKHYIRSGNGLVAIMEQVATLKTMKYVHNDQLGSINVMTDGAGAVLERLSFDAFGKPRNADATDPLTSLLVVQTTRGYTGHKMDAEVGLINMNARLYDATLGRFISADVTIDAPSDMQTFNRYTYVMNNPFASIDPTGNFSFRNAWKAVKPIVKVVVAKVITAAVMVGSEMAGIPMDPRIANMIGDAAANLIFDGNIQGRRKSNSTPPAGAAPVPTQTADAGQQTTSTSSIVDLFIPSAGAAEVSNANVTQTQAYQRLINAETTALKQQRVYSSLISLGTRLLGVLNVVQLRGDTRQVDRIVIGRNMDRVGRYVAEHPQTEFYTAPEAPREMWLENNRAWISLKMDQGYQIIDIGPDPGNSTPSRYYSMELNEIAKRNYSDYHRVNTGY